MQGLGTATADLARYRRRWEKLLAEGKDGPRPQRPDAPASPLVEVTGFGLNPGDLRMLTYMPDRRSGALPLVVVLHGCTQTGRGYDHGAGWSTLAKQHGFALLVPEQQRANNPNLCFNWFQPGDARRGEGEAQSIRTMIDWMITHDNVDPRRVFVTGLSAGGAMTSVMLATYPEVFAGGAVIAGLPHGTAGNVQEAFQSMMDGRQRSARNWGDLVRAASPHRGPWPTVSVWHGDVDATVRPVNAGEIIKQWTDVHGLAGTPSRVETIAGHQHRLWCDGTGRALVEEYVIAGMAHGTPLATADAQTGCGVAGPFLLDVGISSTSHIAKSWGLTGASRAKAEAAPTTAKPSEPAPPPGRPPLNDGIGDPPPAAPSRLKGIEEIIAKALRSAGLMR